MAREFARKFYSSKQWQACRNEYAKKQIYCERCLSQGLVVPGEIVHHKIELTPENINDPSITLNPDNLELVCRNCHADYHPNARGQQKRARRAADQRYSFDEYGRVSTRAEKVSTENIFR